MHLQNCPTGCDAGWRGIRLVVRRVHSPPFKGGVAAQRPGWLVKSREASLYDRAAILILLEIANHH
jgi:hypothetical protein